MTTEMRLTQSVFYVPGRHSIIDTASIQDGVLRSDINEETLEEVRLRHPEAQLGEFHEVTANWENECKSEPVESTEEQFLKMLNILPPVAWTTRADGESFKMSERLYGMITSIYARITEPTSAGVTNRYFHLNDSILTPHDEIITRCSRLLADPPPSILN